MPLQKALKSMYFNKIWNFKHFFLFNPIVQSYFNQNWNHLLTLETALAFTVLCFDLQFTAVEHPKKGLEERKQKIPDHLTQNHSACFKTPMKNSNIPYVIWKSVVFHSIELWSELERNFFWLSVFKFKLWLNEALSTKKICGQIMTMYFYYFLIEVRPKWEPEIWRCPSLLELVNWY